MSYSTSNDCKCLTEIYSTTFGSVYQCDDEQRFYVEFTGKRTAFKAQGFLKLKKQVDKIDVESMLHNPCRAADYAFINLPGYDRFFVLSLSDIIQLKDLLAGASVMLELNSILHERLQGVLVA